MADNKEQVRVDLRSIDELFAEPASDPFDPESRYRSGIDEIADQVRLLPLRWQGRVVVGLPGEAIAPDLQSRTEGALDRYCAAKIAENRVTEKDTRLQGGRGLITALPLLAVLAAITVAILWLVEWSDVAVAILIFWAGLTGWVIVWGPIDTLVYYWRPYRKEAQVYENVRRADLVIEATPRRA